MSERYVSPGKSAFLSTFNFSGAWSLSFESPCVGEENHSIGEDSIYVCVETLAVRIHAPVRIRIRVCHVFASSLPCAYMIKNKFWGPEWWHKQSCLPRTIGS